MIKDQGRKRAEERGDSSMKSGEQSKEDEITKARLVEPYKPLIPFHQRLAKAKLEAKFGNFLEVLKKISRECNGFSHEGI